jgi:hypothetical protein
MKDADPITLPGAFTRLNLAQACGALNDNMVKLLLVFYLVSRSGPGQAGTLPPLLRPGRFPGGPARQAADNRCCQMP